MRQKGQREAVYSSHWTPKVRWNTQIKFLLTWWGHWTNTYYMWCMFWGFSFLEGTIPKGCAIANTITISNEFCMNTFLMQGPMFCFLCTCYLLAYPCSATLKLLSLLWISFSWTYSNSTWNDSSRYLGLFRQNISRHITTDMAYAIMFGIYL